MKKILGIAVFFGAVAGAQVRNYPQVSCYDNSDGRSLTPDLRVVLCAGSPSNAPILCFDASDNRFLNTKQRIHLCARAQSLAPVACFDQSDGRGLNHEQRVVLCSSL
jgi:hypothetical protein